MANWFLKDVLPDPWYQKGPEIKKQNKIKQDKKVSEDWVLEIWGQMSTENSEIAESTEDSSVFPLVDSTTEVRNSTGKPASVYQQKQQADKGLGPPRDPCV